MAQNPTQKALALLIEACPELTPEQLEKLSIGQRDARLIQLRGWFFGPNMQCATACPKCMDHLEMSFDVSDVLVEAEREPVEALIIMNGSYQVSFRVPDSSDLLHIADENDLARRRSRLFERCLLKINYNGKAKSANQLPAKVTKAIMERMIQADPQANVQINLTCPACEHSWEATFDIGSFFWSEINAWVHRIIHDVHVLASAYGWREIDILAMSPTRRQIYLDMVGV